MAQSRKGSWELDPDHTLIYRASDGSVKTFEGRIIAADSDSLSFEVTSRDRGGNDHFRSLRLQGSWQADDRNRLVFLVNDNREDGVLLFRGAWTLDDDQEILYEYEGRDLASHQSFSLQGHWVVGDDERVTYALGEGNFGPEFRCQLESLSLRPKKASVKFRVGTGVECRRRGPVVTVFGDWRIGRDYAVDFDAGSNGSMRLDLSKSVDGGRAFVRLLKDGDDKRIEAGITIPF